MEHAPGRALLPADATPATADDRKRQALALGAQAYCLSNDGLLQAIERILSPADEAR